MKLLQSSGGSQGGSSNSNSSRSTKPHVVVGMPWLFVVVCLSLMVGSCVDAVVTAAAAAPGNPTNNKAAEKKKFISIPLKPHRVMEQERRSLSSLRRGGRGDESDVDHDRRSRRYHGRSLQDSGTNDGSGSIPQQMVGLYQGYGTHYVDLWCGHPKPQRQTLIVGTGSGMTGFPCSNCVDCGASTFHIDRTYREQESETFHQMSCGSTDTDDDAVENTCAAFHATCDTANHDCVVSMTYAEGSSWHAIESIDTCYVGGPHHVPLTHEHGGINDDDIDPNHASHFSFDLIFGCQTSITGLFKRQLADGMMGMNKAIDSFWNQMFRKGKMGTSKEFALCFSRQPTVDRDGTLAGALTLGGVDTRLHSSTSTMVYAESNTRDKLARSSQDNFFVQVRNVYLRTGEAGESSLSTFQDDPTQGLVKLNLTSSGGSSSSSSASSYSSYTTLAIIESGTTDTYWNRGIEQSFKTEFLKMVGREYNHNRQYLSKEEVSQLPTILFQLNMEESGQNSHIKSKDGNGILGLVGSKIDPEHPKDVLLAFPPSHYMEYDKDTNSYIARFYPDDARFSTIGANAMMGHNMYVCIVYVDDIFAVL